MKESAPLNVSDGCVYSKIPAAGEVTVPPSVDTASKKSIVIVSSSGSSSLSKTEIWIDASTSVVTRSSNAVGKLLVLINASPSES